METQTSNTLHNAIMEAGGKDRPPMLAPGNYVQWKSRIKRYIDTKPNHELIHYCLKNPPYKYTWADKTVLVSEGSSETTTETYMETYKNVSQDIRDQLNAEAEAVQIILTGIDNDIYSIVDDCPNAFEMWKAIERLKQGESINVQELETNLYWEFGKFTSRDGESLESYYSRNRGKAIVNSPLPIYDQEPYMVAEDDEMSKDKEIDKLMALISLSFKKIYKPTNNNLRTSSNTNAAESGPIFDDEPLQKDTNDNDHDDDDLANERELLASLIEKLKCEIDDSKNRNKFLETSNKVLVEKLKGEIEDFKNKNKNKSLESSNNRFKEANNKLSETNKLMYTNLKKFQAELDKRNDVKYASKMEIDYAKAKGDLISYKMESQKSFNKYTQQINDLNQTISKMKKELSAHQETISILSQAKEAQIKLYKTREDKELDNVITLENKVKVLDNNVYKTVSEGSPITTTERIHETYKNVSQDIRDQLNAEVEAVQIILTGIDNDIYSTVDACPNASQQAATRNREKAIVNSQQPIYNQETSMVNEDDEMSKDKEIDKLMALISLSFKKIYKPTNNNLRTSSNTSRANQDNSLRINKNAGYENQRNGNVAGARETVGSIVVSPDAADSRPIFDDEPLQKVSNDDHYNVFAMERTHPKQSEFAHDTYPIEQDAQNMSIDSLDMSYDREEIDQDDDDNDLSKECELLASLIEKLKCEIDKSKNRNKFLETSNKALIDKLKESSNNHFKEANNELSKNNQLMYKDLKKFQEELDRYNDVKYASKVE
nr:hypothetical protein [Tanacetum cinerariifolium]